MQLNIGLEPLKRPLQEGSDFFVEFRKMTRSQRARYWGLMRERDSDGAIEHLIACSVSNFRLPSPNGPIIWSPEEAHLNEQHLDAADEELSNFIIEGCLEVNGLTELLQKAREAMLKNSGGSPGPASTAGPDEPERPQPKTQ